jgi:alkylhydroperoxidase family enzyme
MNDVARRLAQRDPLVPLVEIEDFDGPMRAIAQKTLKRNGRIPNQARAMANAGELGAVYRQYLEDVARTAKLPPELQRLIRYKVSTLNACIYCSAHQIYHLTRQGFDKEKFENIHESDTHPAFDKRERAALAFAQAMTEDASNVPDAIAESLVEHFSPAERVEIAITAASMGAMNKINDSLRIPLEDSALDNAGIGIDPARLSSAE